MNAWGRAVLVAGAIAIAGSAGCAEKPGPAQIHREAGDAHLAKSEWKEAAAEYTKSLEIDPKDEKTWEKKAYAHREAGDLDEAVAAILKTVDLKPDAAAKAEVYRNLGGMFMQRALPDKAEEYFNEALKLDANDDQSLAWLAEICAQRGGARDMKAEAVPAELDKALGYYDKVIALKPDEPTTYLNKRVVMAKYMDYERKQKEAAELLAQNAGGDKAKTEEATAKAAEHQARMEDFKKQFEELSKKFSEAQKKAKKPEK